MTEIYGLFDAADPMDPDRVYTAEAFARLFRTMMRDGIVHNDGDELAVSPSVPAAMSVSVGTGMALIQGRYYINDSDLTLNVEAADPSHPRIDRVVVRLEATPGRTVHAVVKKGTPAPSPVPPGLTRTAETWELSLAQVAVGAGATSIIAGNITDERGNVSLCGVAAPTYVPSSQLEVVGAVDMQSNALTGLPVPTTATSAARRDMGGVTLQNLGAPVNANDAARKAYVDSAVGGLGISQVAIDADVDWADRVISNVRVEYNQLRSTQVHFTASDTQQHGPYTGEGTYSKGRACEFVVPMNTRYDNTAKFTYRHYNSADGTGPRWSQIDIYRGGVLAHTRRVTITDVGSVNHEWTANHIYPGEHFYITVSGENYSSSVNNIYICYDKTITAPMENHMLKSDDITIW